jgi:transcriptional regulator with XRE-family HTH domain
MDALPFGRLTLTGAKPRNSAYPTFLTSLGDHIRARRLDLGLRQDQVATQIMVDKSTIVNWELNHKEPTIRHIPKIIDFLGYDPTSNREPTSLGERIRVKRRRLGLSLKELATVLETDQSNVQGWETGRHKPTRRSLVLIGEFLSTTVESVDSFDAPVGEPTDPNLFS